MTDFEPEDMPMPSLAKLHELTAKAAQNRGLALRQFFINPNINPDGPHMVHVVTQLDPNAEQPIEQAEDPEFERVVREAEQAEREEQAEKARESLANLRDTLSDRNKGIGLDD